MSKNKDKNKNQEEPSGKMKTKEFEKELEKAAGRTREVAALGGTHRDAGDHRL